MGQLEIISRLCEVNNLLSDIVKEQQEVIEQSEIVGEVTKERLREEIGKTDQELDVIEYQLRRME